MNTAEQNESEVEFQNRRENEKRKKNDQGLMKCSVLETYRSKGGEGQMSGDRCFYTSWQRGDKREYMQAGNGESRAWQFSRTSISGNIVNILPQ